MVKEITMKDLVNLIMQAEDDFCIEVILREVCEDESEQANETSRE